MRVVFFAAFRVGLLQRLDDLGAAIVLLQLGIQLGLHLGDGLLGDCEVVFAIADEELVERRLLQDQLVLVADEGQRLLLLVLEAVLLLLHVLHTAALLHAHFVERLDLGRSLFDRLLVLGRPDDVLEVLEQAIFVLVAGFGLHLGDRLDLSLEDQETLVVEIHAAVAEEGSDRGEVRGLAVDVVLAGVVLERLAGDDEARIGNDLRAPSGQVHDLLEVDGNLAVLEMRVLG